MIFTLLLLAGKYSKKKLKQIRKGYNKNISLKSLIQAQSEDILTKPYAIIQKLLNDCKNDIVDEIEELQSEKRKIVENCQVIRFKLESIQNELQDIQNINDEEIIISILNRTSRLLNEGRQNTQEYIQNCLQINNNILSHQHRIEEEFIALKPFEIKMKDYLQEKIEECYKISQELETQNFDQQQLTTQLEIVDVEQNQNNKDIQNLQDQIRQQKQQDTNLRKQIKSMEIQQNNESNQMKDILKNIPIIKKKLLDYDKNLEKNENENQELLTLIEQFDYQKQIIESQLEEKKKEKEDLEDLAQSNERDQDNIKKEIKQLIKELKGFKNQISKYQKKIDETQKNLESKNKKIVKEKSKLPPGKQSQTQTKIIDKECQELQTLIEQINDQKQNIESQIQEKKNEKKNLEDLAQLNKNDQENIQKEIIQLEEEEQDFITKINEYQQKKDEITQNIEIINEKIIIAQEEQSELPRAQSASQKKINSNNKQIIKLNEVKLDNENTIKEIQQKQLEESIKKDIIEEQKKQINDSIEIKKNEISKNKEEIIKIFQLWKLGNSRFKYVKSPQTSIIYQKQLECINEGTNQGSQLIIKIDQEITLVEDELTVLIKLVEKASNLKNQNSIYDKDKEIITDSIETLFKHTKNILIQSQEAFRKVETVLQNIYEKIDWNKIDNQEISYEYLIWKILFTIPTIGFYFQHIKNFLFQNEHLKQKVERFIKFIQERYLFIFICNLYNKIPFYVRLLKPTEIKGEI